MNCDSVALISATLQVNVCRLRSFSSKSAPSYFLQYSLHTIPDRELPNYEASHLLAFSQNMSAVRNDSTASEELQSSESVPGLSPSSALPHSSRPSKDEAVSSVDKLLPILLICDMQERFSAYHLGYRISPFPPALSSDFPADPSCSIVIAQRREFLNSSTLLQRSRRWSMLDL